MSKTKSVSVCKQAQSEFSKLSKANQQAFTTYVNETLKKGEYSPLETEKYQSVSSSVVEVKVKGQPAGRMFYTTAMKGHIEIIAFAEKSRNGQDPKIKNKVDKRFKAFKSENGIH